MYNVVDFTFTFRYVVQSKITRVIGSLKTDYPMLIVDILPIYLNLGSWLEFSV